MTKMEKYFVAFLVLLGSSALLAGLTTSSKDSYVLAFASFSYLAFMYVESKM